MRISSHFISALLLAISSAAAPNVMAQDLYVGSNTPNNTIDFTSGTNSYSNTYVGYTTNAFNNLLTVGNTNTLLTNFSLYVGFSGANNRLTISNGASVVNGGGIIGVYNSNNSVLVEGANSLWITHSDLQIGYMGNDNSLIVSNGAIVSNISGTLGYHGDNNSAVVTGSNSLWTNVSDLIIGLNGHHNSLLISNGGTAENRNGYIGRGSSNNSVMVTGIGSLWTNSENLNVGNNHGGNSLVISNSGTVASSAGLIGSVATSSNNSVLVTGSNSLWTNSSFLSVGYAGSSNSLVISNGGRVSNFEGYIGTYDSASNNSVLVTGTGSIWTNSGELYVGDQGSGNSLVISNEGRVAVASNSYIGYTNTSSNNSVLVTGSGSTWNNSGDLYVGNFGSSNSLVISNGAAVSVAGLAKAGRGSISSNNSVVVTGGSSALTVVGGLFDIGFDGTENRLEVSDGGTVTILSGSGDGGSSIGSFANSNSVLVTGANSLLTNAGRYFVGYVGSYNRLAISSNGAFVSRWMTVGNTGNSNSVTVSDGGSLSIVDQLTIGNSGDGNSMVISNGGVVNVGSYSLIGDQTISSNNSVLVTGAGSTWTNSGNLVVGHYGSGNSLVISDRATVANSEGYIGTYSSSSNNSVVVSGSGSLWTNSTEIYVGTSGSSNSLVISNGGMVANRVGYIGMYDDSSNNSVLVTGPGSTWTNVGSVLVGNFGSSNSLVISNGGTVVANGDYYIGSEATSSNNSVLVTESGSLLTNSSGLFVGFGGSSNSLVISNGGTVANSGGIIGNASTSSNNSVLVTGSNSLWTNAGNLYVGNQGYSNSLVISNGGTVANSWGFIGNNSASSNNSVLVTGRDALFNTWELRVGQDGSGNSVVISDGGTITNGWTYIGTSDGANSNTAIVTGTGSRWSSEVDFNVGYSGSYNSLVISDGGMVSNGMHFRGGTIGYDTNSMNNSVLVTGSNSLWTTTADIFVGYMGRSNSLTIANSGSVAASSITIASQAGSSGTLNIGRFGTNDSAGSITAPTITFGSGTGTINFNQTNTSRLTSSISGLGTIQQLGSGTTILSGNNSGLSGTTLISAGTLQATSTDAFGTSAVTLTNSGTLSLSTNLSISSLIWNGGSSRVAISNLSSGAYLNITGALTLTGSGTGTFDLSGNALGANPLQLMAWGTSNSYTTANFSVTGLSGYQLSISNNALWIAYLDLYVGSNSSVSPTNFNSGTNTYGNTYVGYTANASNNLLTIGNTNTVLTNAGLLYVGYDGSSNSMVISNGGRVANEDGIIGRGTNSSNNSVLVTGSNSLWTNSGGLSVGEGGSGNSLTVADGGTVASDSGIIGSYDTYTSSNNSVLVTGTGSLWTNSSDLVVGADISGNSLVISNGGTVVNSNGFIGEFSSNNSVLVTGINSAWTNSSYLYVGNSGSSNSLVISERGTVASAAGIIGNNADSSNNSVLVTGPGSTWTNSGDLFVGYRGSSNSMVISNGGKVFNGMGYIGSESTAVGNLVTVTGSNSSWINSGDLYVGYAGQSNRLVISDGGFVSNVNGFDDGVDPTDAYNSVLVTGSGSRWVNSGNLTFGLAGHDNSLVISNGGIVSVGLNSIIGDRATASNNSVLVTGVGSLLTNSADLYVGNAGSGNSLVISNGGSVVSGNGVIGNNSNSSNNSVLVTETGSIWSNSSTRTIIGYEGSGNSLVISNGGSVASFIGVIGYNSNSSNNSVLVTGSNSLWTNFGLAVGAGGSGALTIANQGTVAASVIVIASEGGSSGTLNIGRFGGSDSAGTIGAPTITFGSGTGTINFNQTNTSRLTSSISGLGTIQQLGTGTTILSGNNTYTGATLVSGGTLVASSTNALGSSTVTLSGGTLALQTNLTISSLIWDSAAIIALPRAGSTNYLTVSGMASLTGSGTNTFDLTGVTLGSAPIQLFNFGTNGFTTNQFSVTGLGGYLLSTSNNALWIALNSLIAKTSDTIISNSATYPSVTFQTNGILTVTRGAVLTITTTVDATNNGTVDVNGVLSTPAMIIPTGGTLMGSGTLSLTGGNLTVNGNFAPGNSPGTFFVSGGNLIMGASAFWDQQIYSASVYDQVVVTGSAILNGTMNITTFGNGGLQLGQKYNFLTASGGISGAFSSIVAPEGFRGRLLLSGDNTQANILIAPASYTQLAANRNQTNVATALNSFIPYTSGDQQVVSTSLDSLTASQYNQAFNAIMPTFYQQISTIAFNNANAQNMQLVQRLWGLRVAEGGGFSMSGLADNMPIIEGQGDGSTGKGVLDSKKDILRPGLDNHWGMFVDGNGIFAQANSGNMLPGYNSQSGGVTTGLTYKWNENVGTGIYCGYQGTCTKSGADGSGLGTGSRLIDNAVRFGVFGTYGQKDGKGLFVNALAGGGYHNFQATRVIQYAGMNRTANSAPGAGELDTMLAAGYDIKKDKFTFGPTASLQYTYLGVNSLNETGAQSLSFNSGGWNSSSMLSSVGAHAAYSWVASKNILVVPQVNLSWQHEFMQNPYAISGNLGGTSPTFSNWSATPIRDFLYTGVGFTVEFSKRWNTSFFYNAAAGNSDLVSQNIFWSAGVKF